MKNLFVLAALVAALTCTMAQEKFDPEQVDRETCSPETGEPKPVIASAANPPVAEKVVELRTIIRERTIVKERAAARRDWPAFGAAKRDIRELEDRVKFMELNPMGGTAEAHHAVYKDLHDVAGFPYAAEVVLKKDLPTFVDALTAKATSSSSTAPATIPPAASVVPATPATPAKPEEGNEMSIFLAVLTGVLVLAGLAGLVAGIAWLFRPRPAQVLRDLCQAAQGSGARGTLAVWGPGCSATLRK